ncbi:MAG: CDP-diacylglycerol--glycerol-3-phosphate 3-phosphatidyltransferase [Oscillospiraceae bacterium]|nr:CDP-diacylglycerol--glycerol-3-phosphate 3-phosphatidyltransferase [Oscillospiraceae bacterium]
MNTPNKLTLLRILLVPVIVFFLLMDIPCKYLTGLTLFIIAISTDLADGMLARKKQLVTNLGKFLDPLADKALVSAVLICFVQLDLTNTVAVIIIVIREFLVTGIRLAATDKGVVIAAGVLGKLKTITQSVAIIIILLLQTMFSFDFRFMPEELCLMRIGDILIWVAAALTVISGVEYFIKNRKHIFDNDAAR